MIGVDLANADVCSDLSTAAGCEKMAAEITVLSGGVVDVVIANAGVLRPSHLCYAVNYHGAICPGLVDTPMQQDSKSNPLVLQLIDDIPLQRTAAPEELAEVFAFLASEQNSYINGQLIYVDSRPQTAQ